MQGEFQRRTRSQLVVPDVILHLPLGRSPLKDAKSAIRVQNQMASKVTQAEIIDHPNVDDSRPPSTTGMKRGVSPMTPARGLSPGSERASKRPRNICSPENTLTNGFDENSPYHAPLTSQHQRNQLDGLLATLSVPKKAQSSPWTATGTVSLDSSIFPPRSKSVPLRYDPAPHIDLTNPPPSPLRSPKRSSTKSPSKSRFTSLPPPDFFSDICLRTPRDDAELKVERPPCLQDTDIDIAGPSRVTAQVSSGLTYPTRNGVIATPRNPSSIFAFPLSPLTPLPPTPFISKPIGSKYNAPEPTQADRVTHETESIQSSTHDGNQTASTKLLPLKETSIDDPSKPVDVGHLDTSNSTSSVTSSTTPAPSRLPRPSAMPPPPVPAHVVRSNTVPHGTSRGKRQAASMPESSRRITRSVSQRRREDGKQASTVVAVRESANISAATSNRSDLFIPAKDAGNVSAQIIGTASTSSVGFDQKNTFSFSFKPPGESAKLKQTSLKAFIVPKVSNKPSFLNGAVLDVSMSNATSLTQPSSVPLSPGQGRSNKFNLSSNLKSPSKLPRPSASTTSTSNPGSSTSEPNRFSDADTATTEQLKPLSSLSTLSSALEKLTEPPPSRPNTSLGFNRLADDEDSIMDSKNGSQDDCSIGKESGAAGSVARPTVSSLKRSATIAGQSFRKPVQRLSSMFAPPVGPTIRPSGAGRIGQAGAAGLSAVSRMRGNTVGAAGNRVTMGVFKGMGITGGRVALKASRKTTLPSVQGSPVKGNGQSCIVDGAGDDENNIVIGAMDSKNSTSEPILAANAEERRDSTRSDQDLDGGASMRRDTWVSNVSRRASLASQALSQSLSALPQTPPPAVGTRSGLRSASSSHLPSSNGSAQDGGGKGKERDMSDISRGDPGPSTSPDSLGGSAGKKGSLKLLKDCIIFVDVRTEAGDDAGGLFVDMLRGMGARILGRVGQSCTHIVFKNGLMSTMTRYRLLNDPKPVVVGIAWVVECVEQRMRVDEEKFKIDLDAINVAGTNKRRRSMQPKQMVSPDNNSFNSPSALSPYAHSADNIDNRRQDQDTSSPKDFGSKDKDDDLPPLEKARRRTMQLGQS